jgi:hypothetical protein
MVVTKKMLLESMRFDHCVAAPPQFESSCDPMGKSSRSVMASVSAIDSTATGENVARRRFQRGSVYQNQSGTVWLGAYSEYVLDHNGIEKRKRKCVVLGPIRKSAGQEMRKKEAERLLLPFLDRVNSSISVPAHEHKSAAFEAFIGIWDRDSYRCRNLLRNPQCVDRRNGSRLSSVPRNSGK